MNSPNIADSESIPLSTNPINIASVKNIGCDGFLCIRSVEASFGHAGESCGDFDSRCVCHGVQNAP
jgi:hypothetical protein